MASSGRLVLLLAIPPLGSWFLLSGNSRPLIRLLFVVGVTAVYAATLTSRSVVWQGALLAHFFSITVLFMYSAILAEDTELRSGTKLLLVWLSVFLVPIVGFEITVALAKLFVLNPPSQTCDDASKAMLASAMALAVLMCLCARTVIANGTVIGEEVLARAERSQLVPIELSFVVLVLVVLTWPYVAETPQTPWGCAVAILNPGR